MKLESLQTFAVGFLHGRLRGPPRHLHMTWFCMKLEPLQPLAAGFLHGRLHETGTAACRLGPPRHLEVARSCLATFPACLPRLHACLLVTCIVVSVEVGNKWREDLRCSKHRQLTSEFGQSFEEQTDEPNFEGWPSSWNSIKDSSIHVSNNPWEQPSFGYVSEQPPMYGGSSSSQPAYTDDGGYIPQMDYTSITGSSFHPEQMQGTPPSMQMDDQWFNDEQTPDPPRRTVHPLNGTIKHHPYTDKNYREEDKK
ncbi:hypothetical protein V6N11_050246 [Hibiscus sabdariffa]|uniref:Uncharacterized protein n=1 Tax=Hibiscus sabdariffa TaxID=183260 RepID=A0ABR2T997_9ROSI